MPKVLSLYCGGGGIDQGLKEAGIKTTLAIDFEKDCCETIKLNFDCEVICGKVSDYKESLENFDVIVGGPPCPEFSNAKMDKTYDPTEVNHFWDIVDRIKPKYHLMENVPGVIEVCKRRNFLLNTADYGTPQTRYRRFFTNLPEPVKTHSEFPSQTLFGDEVKKWVSVKEALQINDDCILQDRKTTFGEGFRNYNADDPAITILADSRLWITPTGFKSKNQKIVSRSIDEPSPTILVAGNFLVTDKPVYSEKYHNFKQEDYNFRKLTNEELAVLQGFPKGYKFFGSISSVKRQIGNSVPPQVITRFFSNYVF